MQDGERSTQTTQSAPDFVDEYDRRERTLKSLAEALVPLLREYRELDGMGDMPEAFEAAVSATGFMGGDAGHGGHLTIRFYGGQSGANEIVDPTESEVTLLARGDMEQAGLICALMEVLEKVLPRYHREDAHAK